MSVLRRGIRSRRLFEKTASISLGLRFSLPPTRLHTACFSLQHRPNSILRGWMGESTARNLLYNFADQCVCGEKLTETGTSGITGTLLGVPNLDVHHDRIACICLSTYYTFASTSAKLSTFNFLGLRPLLVGSNLHECRQIGFWFRLITCWTHHQHRSRLWSRHPRSLILQMYRGTGLSQHVPYLPVDCGASSSHR